MPTSEKATKRFTERLAASAELGIVLSIDETANLRAAYRGLPRMYGVESDLQ